jgi:hypothetical protein
MTADPLLLAGLKAAALYAALVVLMGVGLTYLVIMQRRSKKIGIGDGGDRTAARLIRVHGNFCENAPFALALLILLPLVGAASWAVHVVGILFLVGRVAHAQGLAQSAGPTPGRIAGMLLTHAALIIGSVALLLAAAR